MHFDDILKDPPHPFLFINFDETGFIRCSDKGKVKTVFKRKSSNMIAYWRETQDLHHISLVVAITAGCTSFPPLCLSPRKNADKDLDSKFLYR